MDRNDLDKALAEKGWIYDNGWQHQSQSWDCYVNEKYRSESKLVIVAKDGKGKVLRLQGTPIEKREVWDGPLSSERDVGELLEFILAFETKHAASGSPSMRVLGALLAFVAALTVTATTAFLAVLFLAGPHGGVLPSSLHTATLALAWSVVVVVPILVGRWVWRRLARPHG